MKSFTAKLSCCLVVAYWNRKQIGNFQFHIFGCCLLFRTMHFQYWRHIFESILGVIIMFTCCCQYADCFFFTFVSRDADEWWSTIYRYSYIPIQLIQTNKKSVKMCSKGSKSNCKDTNGSCFVCIPNSSLCVLTFCCDNNRPFRN